MVLIETGTKEEIENLTKPGNPDAVLAAWLNNIKKLHAAGIPIVMGSDSGNWPVMPQMFHGPTSIREIELLTLAGVTPLEAIKSSTYLPAKMLGMDQDIGTIEEGKIADLIIVKGNPLSDIKSLKNVKWTIKDGVAKTPEQWMK
jgi:imidazolonepropionase-like amidohydrolase